MRPRGVGGGEIESPLNRLLRDEEARGEQNQNRHQPVEDAWGCQVQQHRAGDAADDARDDQGIDAPVDAAQFSAISPDARQRAGPDRQGIGSIRGDGGHAQPDQCGKRHEQAAAGDRIDAAGDHGGGKHQQLVHVFAEYLGPARHGAGDNNQVRPLLDVDERARPFGELVRQWLDHEENVILGTNMRRQLTSRRLPCAKMISCAVAALLRSRRLPADLAIRRRRHRRRPQCRLRAPRPYRPLPPRGWSPSHRAA